MRNECLVRYTTVFCFCHVVLYSAGSLRELYLIYVYGTGRKAVLLLIDLVRDQRVPARFDKLRNNTG